jgi:hypothetical protein
MTLMSFFCRMLNGKCDTREPDRESYPKTQATTASPTPPPPPPNTGPRKPPPGTTGGLG